ncbi:hypothetical protein ACI2C5_09430, partial [Campylobacter jejuni]
LKEAMTLLGCSRLKIFVFYHSCNLYHVIKCLIKGKKKVSYPRSGTGALVKATLGGFYSHKVKA